MSVLIKKLFFLFNCQIKKRPGHRIRLGSDNFRIQLSKMYALIFSNLWLPHSRASQTHMFHYELCLHKNFRILKNIELEHKEELYFHSLMKHSTCKWQKNYRKIIEVSNSILSTRVCHGRFGNENSILWFHKISILI